MEMNPWSVALGAIVTGVLSYRVVPWLVDHINVKAREQVGATPEEVRPPTYGGDILGHLECAIFFVSFVWPGAIALAPAWLVFKTAAKWKTWDTTKDLTPKEIPVMYRAFLVGTAANIVAALAGVVVANLP